MSGVCYRQIRNIYNVIHSSPSSCPLPTDDCSFFFHCTRIMSCPRLLSHCCWKLQFETVAGIGWLVWSCDVNNSSALNHTIRRVLGKWNQFSLTIQPTNRFTKQILVSCFPLRLNNEKDVGILEQYLHSFQNFKLVTMDFYYQPHLTHKHTVGVCSFSWKFRKILVSAWFCGECAR